MRSESRQKIPLRIAFHVPRASHLKPGPSGDRVLVPSLLAGLRERGHQVEIVSRMNARNLWRGRVPVHRLITEALRVSKEMRRFSPDAWLVYGPSVTNPDLFGWWQLPKRYVLFAAYPGSEKHLSKWWRPLFAFAHRRSLRRADKVIVLRHTTADLLRSFGVAKEQLCVLPPAVKMWDWMPSQAEARRRLRLPQEAPVILCISRLSVHKERRGKTDIVLDLLAALVPLPLDAMLILVGDGPGRRRVQDQVARLKLQGRVRLAGAIDHPSARGGLQDDEVSDGTTSPLGKDIRWFYAACDLFALPDQEDLPRLSILEAQSCGRPVVTMRTRAAELTVGAGRTGLLAKDLEEFQAYMAALAGDRARCESMGRSARKYIAKSHSMGARAEQLDELLLGRD